MIRYRCRHCETEIGEIPLDSAEDVMSRLQLHAKEDSGNYLSVDPDGGTTISCICEECQQSLSRNPDYYALHKWLQ